MKKIAIIGAGISGLFFANLLKNNSDYEFTIFEKRTTLDIEDGYGIQLSVNSIKLLNQIGFKNINQNEIYNPKKNLSHQVWLPPCPMREAWACFTPPPGWTLTATLSPIYRPTFAGYSG